MNGERREPQVVHTPEDAEFSDPTLVLGGAHPRHQVPAPTVPAPPVAPPTPRRSNRRKVITRVAGGLILAIVLLLVGLMIHADRALHHVDAIDAYSGRPAAGAGTNWLIIGSDSRQGLTDAQARALHTGGAADVAGARTDTIMLLHLPHNGTKPTMVSLLRDSRVAIPGHGQDKINAAFAYGGPSLLVRTVEQNTGLRIDHYAEIGLGGFANVVSDVGGVRMCLDQAVSDSYAGVDLRAGCQTLNGPNALGYVRSRHAFATSDYARTEHQRQFVAALAAKLMSPGVLLNPFRSIPAAIDLPPAVTVDRGTGVWDLVTLARHVRHFSAVTSTAVPVSGSDGSDLIWDAAKSQELFHDLNHDQLVPASLITK